MQNNDELRHSDTYLGETYNDGLYHYKYISKKKINGEWRYYYKITDGGKGFNRTSSVYEKVEGKPNSKYGVYTNSNPKTKHNKILMVKKSDNRLFNKKMSTTMMEGDTKVTQELREIGKIEQGIDAAKSTIGKIGNKTIKSVNKSVNKGKKALSKLLNKLTKKK